LGCADTVSVELQIQIIFTGEALDFKCRDAYYTVMNSDTSAISKRIAQWAAAAPLLQEVRDADIRAADTARSLRNLAGTILETAAKMPIRTSSGLVDQQRFFRKIQAA
jgi:hypothetical protein